MKIDAIKKLRHYSTISDDQVSEGAVKSVDTTILSNPSSEAASLERYIFAPDPETGIPRSDLAIVYSHDADPQISQYIQDTLLKPHPQSGTKFDNPDDALSMMKDRNESYAQYSARLRQYASDSFNRNSE